MAPLKLAQRGKAALMGGEAAKGALAGATVLDPHEQRLSNLVESYPALANPVTQYLAADPSDSAAEGRFKNALESIGADIVLLSAVKAIKLMRGGLWEEAGKEIDRLGPAETPQAIAARQANAEAFGLDFSERLKDDLVTAPEPVPQAGIPEQLTTLARNAVPEAIGGQGAALPESVATTAPPSPTALSESPRSQEGIGEIATPPPSPRPIELTPGDVAKALQDTDTELQAIKQFGSREAALEAGQITARSGSLLPWQKFRDEPDGLRSFMDSAAATLKTQLDAIKGGDVLSDATVNAKVADMAEWFGEDPGTVMGLLVEAGEQATTMASRMEAAYLITQKAFAEAYETSFKLRNGMLDEWGGSAETAGKELKDRLSLATTMLSSAQSIRSNTGRTMRRLRGSFQLKPEDLASLDGMDATKLADLIYSTKGDPQKLKQVANPTFLRRVLNEANFHLANGLLWKWPTHVFNLTSSLMMMAGRPTEKLLGAAVMGPKQGANLLRQQALREYAATASALGDAWAAGVEAFKRGDSLLAPHNTEMFQGAVTQQPIQWKPVKGVIDLWENVWNATTYRNAVGLPTRSLGAVDEMFKTMRYRAYVQGQAATKANSMGLKGDDFHRYVTGELEKAIDPATGQALDRRALQEAQTATFQNELLPHTFGATIQQARQRHPVLTLVLPFVKTPVNVLRYGWRMTPGLDLLQKDFREAISGAQGAEAQAHAVGQMSLGGIFMGLAAVLAVNGKVTGSGPTDARLQAELRATGWQPNSYVLEGADGSKTYIPIGRFDPVSMPFVTMANLVNALQIDPDSKEAEAAAGALLLSIAKSFTDRTFLENINQVVQALSEPERRGEKWLASLAGNVMPFSSLMSSNNPDAYLRDARGFVETAMWGLPGYSETLPPARDVFGEPVWRRIGISTKDETDEVEAEHNRIMIETGKFLGKPSPDLGGTDLRDVTLSTGRNAYDRLQELGGQLPNSPSLRERLKEIIKADWYQDLPDGGSDVKGTRLNVLSQVTKKYREVAKAILLAENPELQQTAYKRQVEAVKARQRNMVKREPGARELLEALTPN